MKWLKQLFFVGCNEVLKNAPNSISGVIFSQKLFSLGIGSHILTICKIKDIPCVILPNNDLFAKLSSNSPISMSCIGLRNKVLLGAEEVYEPVRFRLEQLIRAQRSSFEVPYLTLDGSFDLNKSHVKIIPPIVGTTVVNPKIEYPKSMKRSEKRKLRKERRSRRS
ncbi:hypothetical protein HWI79_358 [Cryptosporidium felis]|nr:hypothetical protein HWI79_358 [Cryptosporidium felis]